MSFLSPAGLEQYLSSTFRLQNADPETDVELTNHPWGDGTLIKLEALEQREAGGPHPFVTGHESVKRWLELLRHCTRAVLSEKRAASR